MRTCRTACAELLAAFHSLRIGTGSKYRFFAELAVVLFQVVTLPVEFNASRRGLRLLGECGILYDQELPQTRKVLKAAALTYVAGVLASLLQLLRLLMIANRRRD